MQSKTYKTSNKKTIDFINKNNNNNNNQKFNFSN